jgi:hypothetical protein
MMGRVNFFCHKMGRETPWIQKELEKRRRRAIALPKRRQLHSFGHRAFCGPASLGPLNLHDPLLNLLLKYLCLNYSSLRTAHILFKPYMNILNVRYRSVSQERRRLRDRLSDDRNTQNLFKGFLGKCNN